MLLRSDLPTIVLLLAAFHSAVDLLKGFTWPDMILPHIIYFIQAAICL